MSLYLKRRFFLIAFLLIALFVLGYASTLIYYLALGLMWLWIGLTLFDVLLLYALRPGTMQAHRTCADRFSNGDPNEISIALNNPYRFPVHVQVVDEMPVAFQMRDSVLLDKLAAHEERTFTYSLTPHQRGAYHFDRIRIFFSSPLGLAERRFTRGQQHNVKVYPSFARLSHYSLLCNRRINEHGIKRIRKVGADTDFEQIKDYVVGDEYRYINWKASARTNTLKVNVYQQDRSMPVYCIVDKGRMMRQSAFGLTFLEYAINAALALSYVAIEKDDQAGLVTLAGGIDDFVPAGKLRNQMPTLMEALYNQETIFAECDYSALSTLFMQKVTKRCLAVLFANFSTLNAFNRELPYLTQIARRHQLLIIMFRDKEMEDFVERKPRDAEERYQQRTAEKYYREKRLIIRKLRQSNILTLYVLPEQLSVGVINRYLEYRRF